jgi:hypothetical protein
MMSFFARKKAMRVVRQSARKLTNRAGIDPHRGWRLLWGHEVPTGAKFSALAVGIVITALLLVMEFPIEGAIAAVAPPLGFIAGALGDGIEIVLLPLLIACSALSLWVKPQPVPVRSRHE